MQGAASEHVVATLACCVWFGFACPAQQQITLASTLQTDLVVQRASGSRFGSTIETRDLPAGTDLRPGASIAVGPPTHRASVTVAPVSSPGTIDAFSLTANVITPQGSNASGGALFGASTGNATVLLRWSVTELTFGDVVVTEQQVNSIIQPTTVDVGDDGVLEWEAWDPLANFPNPYPNPRTGTFPVAINPGQPLVVRLQTSTAQASGVNSILNPQNETTTLNITFVPASTCGVSSIGSSCVPSLNFDARFDPSGQLEFSLSGVPTGATAAVIFGFSTSALVLPLAPGCTLWTSPDLSAALVPSATQWSLALPVGAPLGFNAQAAVVDVATPTVTLSEGLGLACR